MHLQPFNWHLNKESFVFSIGKITFTLLLSHMAPLPLSYVTSLHLKESNGGLLNAFLMITHPIKDNVFSTTIDVHL